MFDSILAASMHAANLILAQSAPSSGPGGGGGSPLLRNPLILMVVVFAIFWFVMSRDQRKKKSSRAQMLDNLKKGDKVLTVGGILGTIVGIKDNEVTIKVDESSNTKITFVRSAVDRLMTEREGS